MELEEGASRLNVLLTDRLRNLAAHPLATCVGECGLDYTEGFPSREVQLPWFEAQVRLAFELGKPLFLHERLAHSDFCQVFDDIEASLPASNDKPSTLPPCLVHCFTGTKEELLEYLRRGFLIGISGFLLKDKGVNMRDFLDVIPLNKLVIETDAPYLGFRNCRVGHKNPSRQYPNVPSALPLILQAVAGYLNLSPKYVAQATTANAYSFFGM
eukprot:104271_1